MSGNARVWCLASTTGALVLACVCAVLSLMYAKATAKAGRPVRFLCRDTNQELAEYKNVQIGEWRVTVAIMADGVFSRGSGTPWADVKPYVRMDLDGPPRLGFDMDPKLIEVKDSEGHRFEIVAAWPEGSGSDGWYRFELDAIEFNRYVKYQPYDSWPGMLAGKGWRPDERYTLSLRVPFEIDGVEHAIEIPRIACFPRGRFRKSSGRVFPTRRLYDQWDRRE